MHDCSVSGISDENNIEASNTGDWSQDPPAKSFDISVGMFGGIIRLFITQLTLYFKIY